MPLDPNDPFFEGALRNIIRDEIGPLPTLVRQLQGNGRVPYFSTFGVTSVSFGAASVESTGVALPVPTGATAPVGCLATCNTYPGTAGRVIGVSAYVNAGAFEVNAEVSSAFGSTTAVTVSYFQWWT